MKTLRIVAGLQLVLAVIFAIAAFQIDPGVSDFSRKAAKNCQNISSTLRQMSKTYEMGIRQLPPVKSALLEFSRGTENLSGQTDKLGSMIRKIPGERFEPTARAFFQYSRGLKSVSQTLLSVEKILAHFETVDYPQTMRCINEVADSLNQAETVLNQTSSDSRFYIKITIFITCLIFILNAIALFAAASAKRK